MHAPHLPVRVGFIGAGGICDARHFPGLAQIPGVDITAVCNRTEASGRRVADKWGIPAVETDWRRLLAREDVDAVFIGTWPYMHHAMCIASLQAGKHVFCQARMACDLAEARGMAAAADAHPGLVNMICPPPHRMPWEPCIRKMIADGTLGQLRSVRVVSTAPSNLGELTWRERVEYSGKHILAMGIYAETLNAWVGDYATLSATTATPMTAKQDEHARPYTIRIPQVVAIHGTLANGALISEYHSGIDMQREDVILMTGSEASLRVDVMRQISLARNDGVFEPMEVATDMQRGWRVEQDFIDAVRAAMEGVPAAARSVSPDFAEGLRYMCKVEAVHASAARGGAAVEIGAF